MLIIGENELLIFGGIFLGWVNVLFSNIPRVDCRILILVRSFTFL